MKDSDVKRILRTPPASRKLHGVKGERGLYLRVEKTGSATWIYRFTQDGSQTVIKLGCWPEVNTTEAKKRCESKRGQKNEGTLETKATVAPFTTVNQLALAYEDYISDTRKRWREEVAALKNHVLPTLGKLKPTDVDADDARRVLNALRKTPATHDKVMFVAKSAWTWAQAEGRLNGGNPWANFKKIGVTERTRKLKGKELRTFVKHLADKPLTAHYDAIRLILLTGVRRKEAIQAKVSEFDLDEKLWTIPGSRTKNGREHEVHLSDAAAAVIARNLDEQQTYLFPSDRTSGPVSDVQTAHVLRNLIADMRAEPFTLHDLRRSMATWCAEQKAGLQVIERMLNHTPQGTTARHYAQAELGPDAADWWQRWSEHLAQQTQPTLRAVS